MSGQNALIRSDARPGVGRSQESLIKPVVVIPAEVMLWVEEAGQPMVGQFVPVLPD
jgi:hypothetical protein